MFNGHWALEAGEEEKLADDKEKDERKNEKPEESASQEGDGGRALNDFEKRLKSLEGEEEDDNKIKTLEDGEDDLMPPPSASLEDMGRQISNNPPPPYSAHSAAEENKQEQEEKLEEPVEDKDQSKKAKKSRQRAMLLREILQTEENYVSNLQVVVDCFIVPLRALIKISDETHIKGAETSAEECRCVSVGCAFGPRFTLHLFLCRRTLFSNLETILPLNKTFLADLSKSMQTGEQDEEVLVGKVFLDFSPFFKSYASYVCSKQVFASSFSFGGWPKH